MRALLVLLAAPLALAACGDSGYDNTGDDGIFGMALSCTTSMTDYCASHHCMMTTEAAMTDQELCFLGTSYTRMSCDRDYVVLVVTSPEGEIGLYYKNDKLAARVTAPPLRPAVCDAGDQTFIVPRCGDPVPLDLCRVIPPEGTFEKTVSLSCAQTLDTACGSPSTCWNSLSQLEHTGGAVCGPGFTYSLQSCGGYDVVTVAQGAALGEMLYRDGTLVAEVSSQQGSEIACTAGPSTIDYPLCFGAPAALCELVQP